MTAIVRGGELHVVRLMAVTTARSCDLAQEKGLVDVERHRPGNVLFVRCVAPEWSFVDRLPYLSNFYGLPGGAGGRSCRPDKKRASGRASPRRGMARTMGDGHHNQLAERAPLARAIMCVTSGFV